MPGPSFETHEVFNQPHPPAGRNLFDADTVLMGAAETVVDRGAEREMTEIGGFFGAPEAREFARLINANPPSLRAYDPYGRRIDTIDHHPAWVALMQRAAQSGLGISLWDERTPAEGGRRHVLRAVRMFLAAQTEPAHLIPWSQSSAAVAGLLGEIDLADQWLPHLVSRRYDYRPLPRPQKAGVLIGLGLTEKQGPMENAATITDASRLDGRRYTLVGHKWWVAAPTSDALIVLADAPGGPSAFLVPRMLDDGKPNRITIQRLKPTIGMRGLAAGELEFRGAEAHLVGDEGGGAELLVETRRLLWLDATTIAAGIMRGAVTEAVYLSRHRKAGADKLVDVPLQTRVLADMALDVAAATALVVRLAVARDRADQDPAEDAYFRLVAPAAKYWTAKTAAALTVEAVDCVGSTAYVDETPLARALRDAPALSLWAGTGNALANEVVRVVAADPDALDAALADIGKEGGPTAETIRLAARACVADPGSARILTEQLALAAAAAALARYAPRALSEAFVDTRLTGPWRASYGMLDGRFDSRGIVNYTYPGI
jgi:putative acyl-CoA dehydrogenase